MRLQCLAYESAVDCIRILGADRSVLFYPGDVVGLQVDGESLKGLC